MFAVLAGMPVTLSNNLEFGVWSLEPGGYTVSAGTTLQRSEAKTPPVFDNAHSACFVNVTKLALRLKLDFPEPRMYYTVHHLAR